MWKFYWFYSENYEVAWLHISSENLLIQNPFSKSLHQALVKFKKDPQRKYWKFCKRLPPFCLCYDRAMCALILQALLITRDGGETKLQRNSWKGILLIKKRLKSLQEFTPILFACYEMAICPNFEIHCLWGMVPPLSWWRVKLLRTSWTFVWFHYLHVDENVNRFAHFVSGAITLMSWW